MQVRLPDGSTLDLPDGASGADAAAAIGPGLAKAALGVRVVGDGLHDLAMPLHEGDQLQIVTARDSDPDALWLIRHDAAHVLATAVMELYPGVKISIGPPIEDGFYYDFEFPEGTSISEDDFARIEDRMREHIAADEPFVRSELPVDAAIERFRGEGQDYKVRAHRGPDPRRGHRDRVPLYERPIHRSLPRARTRPRPSASRPSSSSPSPARTGAARPTTRCSRGSTAPRS